MSDRFESFTYLILKTGKLIQKIKQIEMSEYGLKAVHVMCIYFLDKSNNGLSNKDLVEATQEDKAAISRALALLKEKDIVDYDGNKYNSLITLTKYGKELANHINERSLVALNKSSNHINNEERENLYNTLNKILSNMEDYYNELVDEEKK